MSVVPTDVERAILELNGDRRSKPRSGDSKVASPFKPLPVLKRLSDVEPERVEWLSRGRLAKGKITLCDGDPGNGKSTVSINWASAITQGRALPDGRPMPPAGVVMICPEDGAADTVRPRFEAAGADLNRVVILEGSKDPLDKEEIVNPPVIPRDLPIIRQAIEEVSARLLIIDPLFAILDPEIRSASDQEVRRALTPLARLADETGVAVLIIRHLNKSTGGSPIYRGGGSIGIIGVARFGMLVGVDPDDPDVRIIAPTKVNIGRMPASLRFRLVESPNNPDVAAIEWLGESGHSASQILAGPGDARNDEEEETGALAEAKAWLASYLSGGSQPVRDIKAAATQDSIKFRTLQRAKAELGVNADREGGIGRKGSWYWQLPPSAKDANESPKDASKALRMPMPNDERGVALLGRDGAELPGFCAYCAAPLSCGRRYLCETCAQEVESSTQPARGEASD